MRFVVGAALIMTTADGLPAAPMAGAGYYFGLLMVVYAVADNYGLSPAREPPYVVPSPTGS